MAATKPAASWVEEGGELVFTDPSFNQVILDAYKLSVATKVSEELLADNQYDLEGFLIRAFGAAIAAAEEEAFLVGDGSSKPSLRCKGACRRQADPAGGCACAQDEG